MPRARACKQTDKQAKVYMQTSEGMAAASYAIDATHVPPSHDDVGASISDGGWSNDPDIETESFRRRGYVSHHAGMQRISRPRSN